MSKREFLQKLREYLSYELPESYVESNVRYYSDYIDTEVRNGRRRDDVLEDLGDPQLIARTIIDAAKAGSDGIPNTADDRDFSSEIYGDGSASSGSFDPGQSTGSYGNGGDGTSSGYGYGNVGGYSGEDSDANEYDGRNNNEPHIFTYSGNGCLIGLFIILIIFGITYLAGSALALLAPIIAPLCIVLFIVWLWKRRN